MLRPLASGAVLGAAAATALLLANPSRAPAATAASASPPPKKKPHACATLGRFVDGCETLRVFSGTADPDLAAAVARGLGARLSPASVGRFNDGEVSVKIDVPVRGADVYVVQPTSPPVADNLMEVVFMVSALREASAKRVTAVIPYFGYLRSDGSGAKRALRHASSVPASSAATSADGEDDNVETHRTSYLAMADVARMLEVAGASRVVSIDMHSSGQSVSEGFFNEAKVEHLKSAGMAAKALVPVLGLRPGSELVVVAHSRCFTKAKKFQFNLRDELYGPAGEDAAQVGLALVVRRPTDDPAHPNRLDLVGDVRGKDVLIVDDVVDSGRSLVAAAEKARADGARRVFAFVSHPVLVGGAAQTIQSCVPLERVVALNTVPVSAENRAACPKLALIDVAPMLSELVKAAHVSASAAPQAAQPLQPALAAAGVGAGAASPAEKAGDAQ